MKYNVWIKTVLRSVSETYYKYSILHVYLHVVNNCQLLEYIKALWCVIFNRLFTFGQDSVVHNLPYLIAIKIEPF